MRDYNRMVVAGCLVEDTGAGRVRIVPGGPMDADTTRRFPRGKLRRDAIQLFTVHAMGTARMSGDPARRVVSSFGEHHDVERLFVADASVLPGPVGVNPMETIVALAARSAERLI